MLLRRRASLLLLPAAVLLCVAAATASLPAGRKCPHYLDCAKQKRHFCSRGSSHCGPCLDHYEENEVKRCVLKNRHHQHGKVKFYPEVDEEIDFLHSIIEKQEVSDIEPPRKQSKQLAAVNPQTDSPKQKSQDRPLNKTQHATTAAPYPVVSTGQNTTTPVPKATGVRGHGGPIAVPAPKDDKFLVIMISLCVVMGTVAVVVATVCGVKLQRESRLAEKVDYPAFGASAMSAAKANGTSMGDKTLAQSAQMYHYQHQKQQMLSVGNHKPEQKVVDNEVTSDEEEVGGDFTVYECPGLAPTGEMEVKNPLFDDSTIH